MDCFLSNRVSRPIIAIIHLESQFNICVFNNTIFLKSIGAKVDFFVSLFASSYLACKHWIALNTIDGSTLDREHIGFLCGLVFKLCFQSVAPHIIGVDFGNFYRTLCVVNGNNFLKYDLIFGVVVFGAFFILRRSGGIVRCVRCRFSATSCKR